MVTEMTKILTGGKGPQKLRKELQQGQTKALQKRRAIIALSLLGMGAMTAVSLFQTGVIGHLPDPPIDSFDSDKVNSSDTAYALGVPDGTLSLASLATNIPLAAFGGADRSTERPIVPIFAAGKSIVEAIVAGWYFYQMPAKEHAWCGYCITGAICNIGIAALSVPEALQAYESLAANGRSRDE